MVQGQNTGQQDICFQVSHSDPVMKIRGLTFARQVYMKPLCHGLNELKEFAMSSHRMTCKPNILVNGREGDCWSIGVLDRKVIEKSYPENGWRVISISELFLAVVDMRR